MFPFPQNNFQVFLPALLWDNPSNFVITNSGRTLTQDGELGYALSQDTFNITDIRFSGTNNTGTGYFGLGLNSGASVPGSDYTSWKNGMWIGNATLHVWENGVSVYSFNPEDRNNEMRMFFDG